MINNATFFAGYNHLHHFHKANVLYHFYHNDEEYFEGVVKPKYDELQLSSFYFPGEESYFKRTMLLEMRNTYLHAVETMFTLLEVLRVNHERLVKDPEAENILFRMIKSDQKNLYHNIEKYGNDQDSLSFLDKVIAQEWTLGRFLFYPAINPPEERLGGYLERVTLSVQAIKKGLHLMARDFVRHEYNSYKHGLRVLDAFDYIAFRKGGSRNITKIDLAESFTYPRIIKEKGKRDKYEVLTRHADLERDYRMCMLASRFMHLMTNNRRIAFTKASAIYPETIPVAMFDEDRIDWHSKEQDNATRELLTTDEFVAWFKEQAESQASK